MALTDAAKKKAELAKKGAFVVSIGLRGNDVLDARTERVIKAAKNAQTDLIRTIETEIDSLEDEQDRMLDQSPENRYALNVAKEFDAKEFARKFQEISIKLANKRIELQIAEKNSKFLYGNSAQ